MRQEARPLPCSIDGFHQQVTAQKGSSVPWILCTQANHPWRRSELEGTVTVFTFTYILSGSGWSEATITDDGEALTLHVSYLSNALRDLTDAMIALMRGATHASCAWQGEDVQHEYRWIFDQDDGDVHVKIVEFDRLFSRKGDYQGTTIFSTRCPRRRLVGQVLNQLWRILTDLGFHGYKERWHMHDFPLDEYRLLEDLMRADGTQ
jgi:hypothetical protein